MFCLRQIIKKMFLLLQLSGLTINCNNFFTWNEMFEPDIPRKRAPFFFTIWDKKVQQPSYNTRELNSDTYNVLYSSNIYTIIIKHRVNDNPKENYDIIMLY
jgi:hypothetical protein